jgi:hypothetical protein
MGKVHGSPTWRKPALTLDGAIPSPPNGEVLRGGLDNGLRGRMLQNPGRGRSEIRLPNAPPQVLRGKALAFSLRMIIKSRS